MDAIHISACLADTPDSMHETGATRINQADDNVWMNVWMACMNGAYWMV